MQLYEMLRYYQDLLPESSEMTLTNLFLKISKLDATIRPIFRFSVTNYSRGKERPVSDLLGFILMESYNNGNARAIILFKNTHQKANNNLNSVTAESTIILFADVSRTPPFDGLDPLVINSYSFDVDPDYLLDLKIPDAVNNLLAREGYVINEACLLSELVIGDERAERIGGILDSLDELVHPGKEEEVYSPGPKRKEGKGLLINIERGSLEEGAIPEPGRESEGGKPYFRKFGELRGLYNPGSNIAQVTDSERACEEAASITSAATTKPRIRLTAGNRASTPNRRLVKPVPTHKSAKFRSGEAN